jgi:hypothetical protein
MLCHVPASGEAAADEIAFVVHVGVDVVGELAVALVALESHVVRRRSHPQRLPAAWNAAFTCSSEPMRRKLTTSPGLQSLSAMRRGICASRPGGVAVHVLEFSRRCDRDRLARL